MCPPSPSTFLTASPPQFEPLFLVVFFQLLSTALADRDRDTDKDKRRDRQGVLQLGSAGLRRGMHSSGSGRAESSHEGCSGLGAEGSGFSEGGAAPGKGRRGGHSKVCVCV